MGFLRLPILPASVSSDCWVRCLLHTGTGIAVRLSVVGVVFTVSTVGEGSSLLVGVRGGGGSFVVGVGVGRVVGGGGGQ